ncbi:hypothetical protein M3Y95_00828000 [Aphelenchoides besseyi]|nr:hypothetical protein M3Y95_00828000 [Aphelenchoides besseyi]
MIVHTIIQLSFLALSTVVLAQGPTCADGIDAFIECDQTTRICDADRSLNCELIMGTYYCCAPPLTTSTRKTTTRPSSSTVQPTTLPFPTTKTFCRDIPSDCPKSTSLCSHPAYKDIMARECPASCGLCFPACFDSNPRCIDWVSHGFCVHPFFTPQIRAQHCAQSCDLCSLISQ